MSDLTTMTDLDVLVNREIQAVNAFGYGSYRFENQAQTARYRAEMDKFSAEAKKRGLLGEDGVLTDKGKALKVDEDPRVRSKSADNRQYFAARFGGRGHHTSPYGERY